MCSQENCQAKILRIEQKGRLREGAISAQNNHLFLPGMEQRGRPLPRLVGSGRPLLGMEQSGRPVPSLQRSGQILRRPLS
jgi:hypothetical protein